MTTPMQISLITAVLALAGLALPMSRADVEPSPAPDPSASNAVHSVDDVASATTRPSPGMERPGPRHHGAGMGPPPGERFEPGGARSTEWRRGEPISDERWEKLGDFMKKYSPKRWERLQDLSEQARNRIGRAIDRRVTQLHWLENADPRVYQVRLKRMQIEDEIFSLGWQLTHDNPDKPDEVRKKLRQQVTALVHNRLDERVIRIHEMQTRLDQERQLLKQDEAQADTVVEAHMKAIESNSRWPQLGDFAGSAPPPGPAPAGGARRERARPGQSQAPGDITATVKKAD